MDLCLIEENDVIDPLRLITPIKEYIPDYLLIKDTDKTSNHLPPSADPFVCDCWKRVQIEHMKTRWDGPYFNPWRNFQLCKWHHDETENQEATCHFGTLPIEIQENIWGRLANHQLATCRVVNRRWNKDITEIIW